MHRISRNVWFALALMMPLAQLNAATDTLLLNAVPRNKKKESSIARILKNRKVQTVVGLGALIGAFFYYQFLKNKPVNNPVPAPAAPNYATNSFIVSLIPRRFPAARASGYE